MEELISKIFSEIFAANIPQIAEAVVAKLKAQPQEIKTLTRREAANALNMSLPTLDKLIDSGEIRAKKVGRKVVIPATEIENLLSAGEPLKYRRA